MTAEEPGVSGRGIPPELSPGRDRTTPLSIFLAFFLLYASLSPLHFRSMGYMNEEFIAAKQVIESVMNLPSGGTTVDWPRHGGLPVVIHLPFVAVGQILPVPWPGKEDRVFALEPVVLTAGLLTIMFLWGRRLGASTRFSLAIATVAAFCTILWPYAYFGMEPGQSLFLLLAGYVAIAVPQDRRPWASVILLAVSTGMAAAIKSTGVFLIPALLYANWVFFREPLRRNLRMILPKFVAAAGIAGTIILLSAYTRSLFWKGSGGTSSYLELWLVREPITYLINVLGFLASPNKGLFVFVPLALFAVIHLGVLLRRRSDLAVFAALISAAIAFSYPLFRVWSDETFGPRYFHCAIAPLLLCIVEAFRGRERRALKHPGFVLAAVLGFVISGLGAFFGYGNMQFIATQTGQATLENFQSNPVWNHVRFNARLFLVWLSNDEVIWTPEQRWLGEPPSGVPPWKSVNLTTARDTNMKRVAVPQAYLISAWGEHGSAGALVRSICIISFFSGVILLVTTFRQVRGDSRQGDPGSL